MKLGKTAPKIDPRTLMMADYVDESKLPAHPSVVNRSHLVKDWGLMLNDKLGDCTCASIGHIIQLMSTANQTPFVAPDDEILKAYEAVSGYVPGNEATDSGANMLDTMNYWRNTGVGGHRIDAFVKVATRGHVRLSVWLFGAVDAGIQLPLSCQRQFSEKRAWTVTDKNLRGDAGVGSWGGHAVPLLDYNSVGPVCITWGRVQQMTWAFWDAYADEAYVPLSPDWVTRTKEAPSGFDFDKLFSDLRAL